MNIAAMMAPLVITHQSLRLRRRSTHPLRWWPALVAAWQHCLDQRIENDLRWLGHADVLADFRRASTG